MAELIGGLALLVVAPYCALVAIWLVYRVATKAQRAGSFTRRQTMWLAGIFMTLACTAASSGVALLRWLPATDLKAVWLIEIVCGIAVMVAAGGLIDALIPGIWWLLLPWWAPAWLQPRSHRDAIPRQ